jgi:hypothetical protein
VSGSGSRTWLARRGERTTPRREPRLLPPSGGSGREAPGRLAAPRGPPPRSPLREVAGPRGPASNRRGRARCRVARCSRPAEPVPGQISAIANYSSRRELRKATPSARGRLSRPCVGRRTDDRRIGPEPQSSSRTRTGPPSLLHQAPFACSQCSSRIREPQSTRSRLRSASMTRSFPEPPLRRSRPDPPAEAIVPRAAREAVVSPPAREPRSFPRPPARRSLPASSRTAATTASSAVLAATSCMEGRARTGSAAVLWPTASAAAPARTRRATLAAPSPPTLHCRGALLSSDESGVMVGRLSHV